MPGKYTVRSSFARDGANYCWLPPSTFSFADCYDTNFWGLAWQRLRYTQALRDLGAVVSGALEHKTSMETNVARSWVQHATAGNGITHSEKNASKSKKEHFLQLWAQQNPASPILRSQIIS
ncbi:hypothetical protein BJ742DRAFT_847985 [Cladochytrium replicatum]|nr:hypothetical protein BJ742DRAFT_847985 [Cladochytrium replicatum]